MVFFALLAAMLAGSANAWADLTELQPMNLGRWVITKNDSKYSIIINTDGSYSSAPQLIMLDPPQPGIYRIDDLPKSMPITNVTVTVFDPLDGGGQSFLLDGFQVLAPDTNDDGEATLTVGLRIRTSGNGEGYGDDVYNGALQLDIHF